MTREPERSVENLYCPCRLLCEFVLCCLLGILSQDRWVHAQDNNQTLQSVDNGNRCVVVEIYFRKGQQESVRALSALEEFSQSRQGLLIAKRDVSASDKNRKRLQIVAKHYGVDETATPLVYACNQVIAGFPSQDEFMRQLRTILRIEVFVRQGCPRCGRAKTFLGGFSPLYSSLQLVYRDIKTDAQAVADMNQLVRQHRTQAASVPVFHLCNRLIVGFSNASSMEKRLHEALQKWTVPCKKKGKTAPSVTTSGQSPLSSWSSANAEQFRRTAAVSRAGFKVGYLLTVHRTALGDEDSAEQREEDFEQDLALPLPPAIDDGASAGYEPPDAAERQQFGNDPPSVQLPFFGEIRVKEVGLPALTIAMGLVDGFNPCAMWVLLFLLSLLVNLKDRWRIFVIAGTFVLVSGLAYFAFMAAWLNVFMLVGYLRPIQVALGLIAVAVGSIHIKDFFALHRGISLSIPESAKPGIYARTRQIITAENILGALVGATILAVMVNIVELLCTAGLPALYTEILTMHELASWQNYAYLALYNVCYMLDDALMVTLVLITLNKRKLQETQGRWLKLLSGVVIAALGVIMIVKPELLV